MKRIPSTPMPTRSSRSSGSPERALLFLALLLPATAGAAGRETSLYPDRPVDFSLYVETASIDIDYGDRRVDTSVDRIGFVWRERFGERLQLGLFGGYAFLTQGNNPPTAGRELDGWHAGVSFDLDLFTTARFNVFAGAAWVYQEVEEENNGEVVEISWNEPNARFGVRARVGGPVHGYAGVRYARLNGEQRRRGGGTHETRKLDETESTGAFVGLEIDLDGEGYVGISAESGFDRRVGLYFGRRF